MLRERHRNQQTIEAVDVVLRAFHNFYPEFTQDGYVREADSTWGTGIYNADDRLLRQMGNILVGKDPTEP